MNATFNFLTSNIPAISESGFVVAEELKLIPRGAFGGTIYELGFSRDGRVVAADTGDQGRGQN